MATKIVMEALSPTMEEGRVIEWKKQEGEAVAIGDVLAEVETDKAVMELVARSAGTLLKQLVAAGATVPVSAPMGWIGQAGESVDGGGAPEKASTVNGQGSTGPAAPPEPKPAPAGAPAAPSAPSQPSSRPAVRSTRRRAARPSESLPSRPQDCRREGPGSRRGRGIGTRGPDRQAGPGGGER